MRGQHAGQQHCAERLMAAADITITKPVNEIIAAPAEHSGAVQNESAYRVVVFSKARLNC
jgi:hypothetical protein